MVYSFLFGPIWSYSVHTVLISLIESILSTKVIITFKWSLWYAFILESIFPLPCVCECVCFTQKKKNFKKVLLGPFDLIQSIQYTLALFGPYWSYCVHFGLIHSPSVLFGPLLIPFCPLWFNSVHFSPIRSKLVLFDPVCPLQSYLVHSGPFCPLRSYSVHLFLFSPIQFPSVLFGPPCFYLVLFCPFGPLCSIRSI